MSNTALVQSLGEVNTAKNPSPCVSISFPPWTASESRMRR